MARASAQTVLYRAARTLAKQPWPTLRDSEWEYYHFEWGYPGSNGRASNRPSLVEDTWLAAEGAARVVQYTNHAVILIGRACAQLATERVLQRRNQHFQIQTAKPPWPPAFGFTYQQIVHLPSEPAGLRRWIDRQARGSAARAARARSHFSRGWSSIRASHPRSAPLCTG